MEAVLNKLGKQSAFHIGELSEIASARRAGNELARRLGFDEVRTGQVALVITEAATNIVKHAREGEILLRSLEADGKAGVEIVALDRGPGMANFALRMKDGISTAGTYGVGMGAIRRMSQEFDVYSGEGQGTVLLMIIWSDGVCPPAPVWQVGAVCLPVAGEDLCGDAWDMGVGRNGVTICAADGLGHGPDAARASDPAVHLAFERPDLSPTSLMALAHEALRGTRGAAMAIAVIDEQENMRNFVGVGNIAGCIFLADGARRHLMSHNGIVGSNLRKVQELVHDWQSGAMLILHSDGIATRWDLENYAGLIFRHPTLIAAVLYRDFARQRDDAMVVVVREQDGRT